MKKVFDFLIKLKENNNREWFQAHKDEFLLAQKQQLDKAGL
jgi:uncharacterized protein (DUF2461 family)